MFFREKAYLLDSELNIIATLYISIQPDSGTVSVRDSSLSSLSLKLDITHSIYTSNRSDFNYTQYVYYDDSFYKIIKFDKYKSYVILKAYECKNVQNKELTGIDTEEGTTYMLEVK